MTGFSWSRAFVSRRNRLVGAFAVLCSASSASAFAQGNSTQAGPPTLEVSVINSTANPVPVTPLNALYLVRLSVDNISGGSAELCDELPVPEGTRVVLETVAADLGHDSNLPGPPVTYVRTSTQFSNGFSIDRGLVIPVTERLSSFAGHLRTMVMTGPVTAGPAATVSLALCAAAGSSVEGVLVGHLLPL